MSEEKRKLTAVALIEFVAEDQGGRSQPPRDQYIAPARIEGTDEMWSLAAKFFEPLSEQRRTTMAMVDFLVEDAPHDLLVAGTQFEWLEGQRVVGRGRITRSSQYVSDSEVFDDHIESGRPRTEQRVA